MSAVEDDLRGQLEAAFAESKGEPEVEKPEVVATPEVETATEKQERERDERGRFVAKSSSEGNVAPDVDANAQGAASGSVKPPVAPPADSPAEPPAQAAAQPQSLAPPNGWSAEAKAKWHELSPEVMAAVQKREQDIAKFTSTRDEHASFGKEMYQTVQPYLATIQAQGGTPATAIKSLLNTAYILSTGTPEQKRNALLQAAHSYGVDLGQPQTPTQPGQIPGLETIQQRLDRLERERQEEQAAATQRLQAEVQTELEAFAADPKHPHFEVVKGHMSALIANGAAKDLQDAYDQAVWARPDTRATLLATQRAEEEQKRRTEAKERAEAARRKSVSITGGPGNTAAQSAPEGRSLREELQAQFSAATGGV